MGGSVFLTVFFGLFLAVGLAILGYGLYSLHFSKQAAQWPTVQGEILTSDFRTNSDDDGTTYSTNVTYRYNAMGVERTGKTIAFGYAGSSSYSFHNEIHHALPVGAQVAVRYDPSRPERAVLSYGMHQTIIFLLIFGTVWTFFTLGMAAMFMLGESGAGGLVDNIVVYSR